MAFFNKNGAHMDQQAASSSADTPSYVSLVRLLQAHPFDFAQFKAQLLYLQSATAPFDINYRIHSDRPREYRRSLLSHATLEKQHSAVKLLLKRGANPNVTNPENSGNYSLVINGVRLD